MSKILQAMKVSGSTTEDISLKLETIDNVGLFPIPGAGQMEEFGKLAASLLSYRTHTDGLVITFACTSKGEGNSFVSYNVARHLAFIMDRPVCWVDANFSSPQKKLAGMEIGFRELLQDPTSLDDIKSPGNLVLVPNGSSRVKTADLLTSGSYNTLLEGLRKRFFFTVVDAPPVLESVDVGLVAEPTDGLVLVVESRRLKYEVVQHGLELLREKNVNVLGSVLNRRVFDLPSALYKSI